MPDNQPGHHFLSANNVEVAEPRPGDILRANAIGRWAPTSGEIDALLDIPTSDTLAPGFATIRYIAGVLIVYVNDAGTIKQLSLGEPG